MALYANSTRMRAGQECFVLKHFMIQLDAPDSQNAINRKATCAKISIKCHDAANQRKFMQLCLPLMISSFHLHDQHLMIINEPRVLRGVFKAINQLHCNSENQQISTMIDGCCRTNVYLRTELLNTALKWRAYKKRKELPASKSTRNFSHFFLRLKLLGIRPTDTNPKKKFVFFPFPWNFQ